MRITSVEGRAWLELRRNGEEAHSPFSVECCADLQYGRFSAGNTDVQFLNAPEFLRTLDDFVLNRALAPQLVGTCDTQVRFFRPQRNANAVMVSFAIGDVFWAHSVSSHIGTLGDFELDVEYL